MHADPDLRTAIRDWECRGMARLMPTLAVLSSLALALLELLGRAHGRSGGFALVGVDSVLLSYAAALAFTHRERACDASPVSVARAAGYDACAVLVALAWCVCAGSLYTGSDPDRQLLGDALTCGLIAQTLVFAMRPRAALLAMATFGGAAIAARILLHLPGGTRMTLLLAGYIATMTVICVVASMHLHRHLLSERRLRAERALTAVLLRDFEDSTRDFLWQVDDRNLLVHVWGRAAHKRGFLGGIAVGDPMLEMLKRYSAPSCGAPEMLERAIAARMPFRDVVFELSSAGRTRWWSFGGKPLLDHAGRFTGYRGIGSEITAVRMSQLRIEHLAHHDDLTGLPNRSMFQGRQAAAERAGEAIAVLLIDLDGFKAVNDAHGHPAGDSLLVEIGSRLRQAVGGDDLAARLGGDEFAILATSTDPAALEALARGVIASLSRPCRVEGIRIAVGASIGIARADDVAPGTISLLKAADLALYRAKSEGRGTSRFFEPTMDQARRARNALQLELRDAIETGTALEVHFQPILEIARDVVVGFEALARWNHPLRGMVPPDQFIPIAEESGLILPLGRTVLARACAEACRWAEPLTVAVNVSPLQFHDPGFLASVDDALRSSGLSPLRLELEVTESMLMEHRDRALETLRQLHARGIRVALDDFGTGYSSLSYLRLFPFDKIKIDRSFVADLDSTTQSLAIIRAIVAIGDELGMTTIAEGVETERQLALVASAGCSHIQGYLISRPLPPDRLPPETSGTVYGRRRRASVPA